MAAMCMPKRKRRQTCGQGLQPPGSRSLLTPHSSLPTPHSLPPSEPSPVDALLVGGAEHHKRVAAGLQHLQVLILPDEVGVQRLQVVGLQGE